MLAVRRLLALALFGVLTAAFAGPAGAARPPLAPEYPETIESTHFVVHFTGPPNSAVIDGISHQAAGDVAALAETAYATLTTGWGYPAPLPDADGKIDIWVQDLSGSGALGIADQDTVGSSPSTAWMAIDPTATGSLEVIAHELTHVIQLGIWRPTDAWLLEGTAMWAGLAASDYQAFGSTLQQTLGAPDMSLTCTSLACGDAFETAGYTRWEFFEYLTERFGKGIVRDVFAQGAVLADPTQTGADLLASTLAAKGTTLSDVYSDYTFAQIAGNYQVTDLKGVAPIVFASLATGSNSGALPIQQVAVNHLATRYLLFTRGSADTGTCYAATLSLAVALPPGIGSKPSFYWKDLGNTPIRLTINGNTATATVPWDTCGGGQHGYLALPNPSLGSDVQVFTVSGSLVVDKSTIATNGGPPLPTYVGPTVPGSVTQFAPSIRFYGAQLVRVSSADRLVRLILFASGDGKLQVALGGKVLGVHTLRAGNNQIKFRLPASTVKSLRSTAGKRASASLLTLTSLSTTGTKGASINRKVVITKPPTRR